MDSMREMLVGRIYNEEMAFNSIEWILFKEVGLEVEPLFAAFNSIEWILVGG